MIGNHKCENCGRNMGDIDEPICHQCEIAELDELERREQSKRLVQIAARRAEIMGCA